MTKAALIEVMAQEARISKAAAERALNAFTHAVGDTLKKREKVTLTGFGTFLVSERKPRLAPHPQTGKDVAIPAAWVPRFRPGKSLREDVR